MIFKRILAGIIDLILLICVALAPIFIAVAWLPQYMDAPGFHTLADEVESGISSSLSCRSTS